MTERIVCVVEGDGERAAVPLLVRRILGHLRRERRMPIDDEFILVAKSGEKIVQPYDHVRQIGIEWYVKRAVAEGPAGVLVIVDAEDRCVSAPSGTPALGPSLLARARAVAGSIPIAVVVANRMFETWFLADARSLRHRNVFAGAVRIPSVAAPESIGGCKGHVSALLGRKYKETSDQVALARVVSLPIRRAIRLRSPSFARLFDAVDRLSRRT